MAVKRVILHLGMAKAGSSSIQHTLFNNTAILEKNSFRYLTEWEIDHLRKFHYLFAQYPVNPISTGHLGKPPAGRKRQNSEAINVMSRIMKTTENETLILSGEYFHDLCLDATIENIKEFIKKYFQNNGVETRIVYLVRNPLTWITSHLQQTLFRIGFMNKDCDYFENEMEKYEGVFNLQKNFSDSLTLLKFEDACLDKDGLVGHFLKTIHFPENELKNINIFRKNDSRCIEVMEFVNYIEAVEPLYPYAHYKRLNPNRYVGDLYCAKDINGVKFDLPDQSKAELWKRFEKTTLLLKEKTGIDYTDYTIPPSSPSGQETYSEQTIQEFIMVFPHLSFILQKHFLKFFEKKYMETAQIRFKQLHGKDSVPWEIFNKRNTFFCLMNLRNKNKLRGIKRFISEAMPSKTKKYLKRTLIKG